MLIYFQPAFYCDVSDSWMFPSKRQRMWVTFAGGYFQLIVWSVCTIVWRLTDPDTLINQVVIVVIVYAGLQTLFNFNPLIKLDGYYMLSDYLEIPNLRAKAFKSLWSWTAREHPSPQPWREETPQLIYGAASILFSTTLLIYVYGALYTWATSGSRLRVWLDLQCSPRLPSDGRRLNRCPACVLSLHEPRSESIGTSGLPQPSFSVCFWATGN